MASSRTHLAGYKKKDAEKRCCKRQKFLKVIQTVVGGADQRFSMVVFLGDMVYLQKAQLLIKVKL